ncbi:uncharacterized protein DUF1672 [Scopulibacillus darangshiensis]|uniref:Uncharacterized protein DUF1672 n=1 Tax=Scopulibacillus darangshiensis TaxID=442528 RepID=A0A4R2NTL7_9BACL|nr:DUF1672 family protein [Scopulibacillus darangshiensis]TCP24901.1 uncharacterized protein DUF1672 [Scopulibacillus darangshiensis]
MKHKKKVIVLGIGLTLLLGGCGGMDGSKHKADGNGDTSENKTNDNEYISVQDYTGQGYELKNGEATDKIAEAHKDEIDKAVKNFFLDKYKTKVEVHNIVGNKDGATVFVESVGEPHFYTYAIVPIDRETKQVKYDGVWSQEGQVEDAIMGGIFALIFDKEIVNLNNYLDSIVKKYPVTGKSKEAIANVSATGYSTSYYYITTYGDVFNKLLEAYLKNPNLSKKEWKRQFNRTSYKPKGVLITIQMFMKEKGVKPDKKILNQLVSDIENKDGLPRGSYSILLNDNRINRKTGDGTKDNTLEHSYPNDIIKK